MVLKKKKKVRSFLETINDFEKSSANWVNYPLTHSHSMLYMGGCKSTNQPHCWNAMTTEMANNISSHDSVICWETLSPSLSPNVLCTPLPDDVALMLWLICVRPCRDYTKHTHSHSKKRLRASFFFCQFLLCS